MPHRCSALVLLAAVASGAAARADDALPVEQRLTVLLTTLAHDRNLTERSGDGLRIGVVYRDGSAPSSQDANEVRAAFQALAGKQVRGLPFVAVRTGVTSAEDLKAAIAQHQLNVIYLCVDLGDLDRPLLLQAGGSGVMALSGSAEHVAQGAVVAAVLRDSKPKLIVNLRAAKAQKVDFDSRLLRMAEVVQ